VEREERNYNYEDRFRRGVIKKGGWRDEGMIRVGLCSQLCNPFNL